MERQTPRSAHVCPHNGAGCHIVTREWLEQLEVARVLDLDAMFGFHKAVCMFCLHPFDHRIPEKTDGTNG